MTDRPIRILRLTVRLNVAGPTLQAILLTSAMRDLGYETILAAGGSANEADSMLYMAERYDIEPHFVSSLYPYLDPWRNLRSLWSVYQLIREVKPDIVHTHTTTAGYVGRIAAKMAGVSVIVHTMHVHPFQGYYNRLRTFVFSTVERIGAAFSDAIITLSESLRAELVSHYHITSRKRITVLPLGFDLEAFAATPRHQGHFRERWSIAQDAPLVGIVGRLLPVKNHVLFLDAAVLVLRQIPSARFAIVGDGYIRASLEQHAQELGLSEQVIFTGWQSEQTEIYSDLDVLTMSSWNEGSPVPIIEALAAGCPVVATEVGGTADLLDWGRFGVLVPSGDAEALAAAIIKVIQTPPDPEPAQSTMLDRYSIERLAQDLDGLYRGLLAMKR